MKQTSVEGAVKVKTPPRKSCCVVRVKKTKQNCFFADSGKGHGMPVKNANVRKNNGTKGDQNVTARPREPLIVLIDVLMTEDASFIALFILNLF